MTGIRATIRMRDAQTGARTLTHWSYDPADPYAVTVVVFGADQPPEDWATWQFARDLLAQGLDGPVGWGDLRVWPAKPDVTAIALSSDDGRALLHARTADLAQFLRLTLRHVPWGHERVDVDACIASLLAGEGSR